MDYSTICSGRNSISCRLCRISCVKNYIGAKKLDSIYNMHKQTTNNMSNFNI